MRELPHGYTVKYEHERDFVGVGLGMLNARGGGTWALVSDKKGNVVVIGCALCRSDDYNQRGELVPGDQFNKRLGRTIALGRALKCLETGQETKYASDLRP